MNQGDDPDPQHDPLAFLAGGGEMGRRIREFDWSTTPLGPLGGWPRGLRSALSICLNSNFPIAIYWGADLVLLYNDDWSPIPGEKHPWALGRPARQAWPEIWHIIEPLFGRVMATGEATRSRDQLLPMRRHGFTEECYFDYTFSPIRGEGGQVEGVFNAVLETTTRVIGERRLRTLRELGAREAGEARTAGDACLSAAQVIAEDPHDLPFALLYLLDGGRRATLAGLAGLGGDTAAGPAAVDLDAPDAPWPFRLVAEAGRPVEIDDLPARFGPLPGGAWPEPTRRAVVLPLARPGQAQLAGFLVAGVSPRLALDDDYRGFLDLLAGHVAAAVAAARAYEEERRRAEELAELDRAKTAFFSNVSHEFRTPLTLMLGPVEDMLAAPAGRVPAGDRSLLEVVRRNGLRLQRLVNALLDFSRIEAGRVRATYEPTDLAALTADLASNFRSACEKAGLSLAVDCPPVGEPAFVDRQMYEKVVLNLLSNAFKFTLEGGIAVSLRRAGGAVELRVRDTGTGIPADEMPRLFERFHRVENARGRTHEGSGIGLALVQELVKLHGGSIAAESEVGAGTTFAVVIPLGSDHLPRERVGTGGRAAPATGADAFVEEALRWLPDAAAPDDLGPDLPGRPDDLPVSPPRPDAERPRVLVADDNADMRRYVLRLLSGAYAVEAVADGAAALDAARRRPPDLILSDVMMPRLDGFGLLKALRADPATAAVPVILLSARAGEESRVEGAEAGADDYLVKPFGARELLARVAAQVQLARLRREAQEAFRRGEERFRLFMSHSPTTAFIKDAEGRYLYVNRTVERQFARPLAGWVGKTDLDLFPPDEARLVRRNDLSVLASRATAQFEEASTGPDGVRHYLAFKFPLPDGEGRLLLAGMSVDITDRKRAEDERERFFAVGADLLVVAGADGHFKRVSPACERTLGWTPAEMTARPWADFLHPDDRAGTVDLDERVKRGREVLSFENRYRHKDGSYRWLNWRARPYPDEGLIYAGATDITERKLAEEAVRQSEARYRALAEAMPFVVWQTDPAGRSEYANAFTFDYTGLTPDEFGDRGWLSIIHPDDAPTLLGRWERSLGTGEPVEVEYRMRRAADGEYRWFHSVGSPIRDAAGRVVKWVGASIEVHDRRTAEQALRESEARFRAVVESDMVGIGFWRSDGTITDANDTLLRMLGYGREDVAAGAVRYPDITPPEYRQADDRAVAEIAASGGCTPFEKEYVRRDGGRIPVLIGAACLPDDPDRGPFFALDITAQKRAEEALRESERRFRQLADAMPQVVWTAGPDGEIDYLNRRWTEYTGQPQTAGNAGWGLILHPDDAPQANARWEASRRGGEPFEMEIRLLDSRERSYRWHLIRTVAVKDGAGRVARWFGTATDIDGQKRAEASSRYLAEASAALAGVADYEGTLRKVVDLAVPYFADWSAVDVADGGGRLRRLAVAHQDAARVALAHELMRDYPPDPDAPTGGYAVLRTGRPELIADVTDDMLVRGARDGRHLGLIRSLGLKSCLCVPLAVSGQPLGVLTFATAESGRRYDEADLALATDLAHRAAVAVENTRLYQALRDADRRKDEFLATLAHELRNPLAPIRNGLQIMDMAAGDPQLVDEARALMERQVAHMVRLIDDLMDISRITRGKLVLRKERVELATVIRAAVDTSRPLIEASGHELSLTVPPRPIVLDADPTRLAQVFSNLLNNAAKYTEPGGDIALIAGRQGGDVVVTVRDNGVGIPPEMLPHVFGMFTQVDRSLERSQGGLGIGLSLVKGIVEMHGGAVEARSGGPGRGSEFVVRLPIAAAGAPKPAAGRAGPDAAGPAAARRILVVDDNEDAARSLARMLKLGGHEARTAHDGGEAVEAAERHRPEVILLDIGLPVMNGYDVARAIRARPWGGDVAIVALTGWGQEGDRRRSKEAGIDRHLVKPLDPAELEGLLAELQGRPETPASRPAP
ncbi:Sensor histidine kinase TmoS [Aquisphaera giovannonii]|uniref:histidine kinase n=1 Tax=Aquisphaera giovannonii TaxID=406548 RepID=A0A5B9WE09_9BACT|nr:PAS domain S-box protein [Aquisphaera giovannonii]QEH38459.1 Sensor histidine kinase TmoS [Aquisphaera giovannonii]